MKRVVAIVLLVLISVAHASAEQLPIRTYTTADGLARDSVHKIVSDPLGYLWFCTSDGLSRFDGYEFVNYSVAQGLPHRIVYDLLITASGDYWIATAAGLAHFNPRARGTTSLKVARCATWDRWLKISSKPFNSAPAILRSACRILPV